MRSGHCHAAVVLRGSDSDRIIDLNLSNTNACTLFVLSSRLACLPAESCRVSVKFFSSAEKQCAVSFWPRFLAAAAVPAFAQPFRIAMREDPDSLDPALARTYVSRIVFAGLCDKLFDINEKLEIVPQLATGYEWADPTTLIIKLRSGVLFQDGTTMDAEAVKYSLMRSLTMQGSFRRSEINAMDHVEVVDPSTVKIVLKEPSSPFLAQLTDRSGMIVSPKAAEAAGKDFQLKAGLRRAVQLRRARAAGPHHAAAVPAVLERGQHPFGPAWSIRPSRTGSIRLANLQAGSTDLVESIIPTDLDAVKHDSKLKLAIMDSLAFQTIAFNVGNGERAKAPIGADARVRQAFELALDREALIQVVYNGIFAPTAQGVGGGEPDACRHR